MKVLVFCFLILNTVSAKADESANLELPLQQGKWSLGVTGSLGYQEQRGATFRVESNLQYFLMDRLSLGITASTEGFNSVLQSSLGIAGTYYFYEFSRSAFYISQSFTREHYNRYGFSTDFYNARTALGYDAFFSESVAFGPRVQYEWNPNREAYERGSLYIGYGVSVFF